MMPRMADMMHLYGPSECAAFFNLVYSLEPLNFHGCLIVPEGAFLTIDSSRCQTAALFILAHFTPFDLMHSVAVDLPCPVPLARFQKPKLSQCKFYMDDGGVGTTSGSLHKDVLTISDYPGVTDVLVNGQDNIVGSGNVASMHSLTFATLRTRLKEIDIQ
jgi:hypothetical protein